MVDSAIGFSDVDGNVLPLIAKKARRGRRDNVNPEVNVYAVAKCYWVWCGYDVDVDWDIPRRRMGRGKV